MNARKFYYIVSIILSIFLFISGTFVLGYLSLTEAESQSGFFEDLVSPFRADKAPMNILVLGGDKVNNNTDTIMLVNFNPETGKINILSIPRDTKVSVKGSSVPKINSAYPIGGPNLAVETVSKFLNVNIKHYVFIDTSVFREIIDELGGVDYYVPVDMDRDDPIQNLHIHLKKGMQHLNGAKAEQFMRFREYNDPKKVNKYYDGSDLKRIEAQQNFISELIRQKVTIANIPKLKSVLGIMFNKIKTDMELDEVMKLSQSLGKINSSNVSMFILPGKASDDSNGWFYIVDKAMAAEIIKNNFNGEGTYVPVSTSKKDKGAGTTSGKSSSGKTKTSPGKNTSKKNSSSAPVDVTKDNPSNSDTNMTGTTAPQP